MSTTIKTSGLLPGEVSFCERIEKEMTRWVGASEASVFAAIAACAIMGEQVYWPGDTSRWRETIIETADRYNLWELLETGGL